MMEKIKAWLRRERETLGRLKGKQRRNYIWDYYKIPIFAVVLVLAVLLVSVLYTPQDGEAALKVVVVNASQEIAGEDTLFQELLTGTGRVGTVGLDANYTLGLAGADEADLYTLQALSAMFGMGDMDLFVANQEVFDSFAKVDGFLDLTTLLPAEYLEEHADSLYRVTNTKGEEIVAGIWLREDSPVWERGYYAQPVLAGIVALAVHADTAAAVLELLP